MNNLVKRIVFGGLYIALMLWAALSNSFSLDELGLLSSSRAEAINELGTDAFIPSYFLGGPILWVFALLAFVAYWEYAKLVNLNRTRFLQTILDALMSSCWILSYYPNRLNSSDAAEWSGYIFALYVLFVFVRSIYLSQSEGANALADLGKTLMGHIYITLPLTLGVSFVGEQVSGLLLIALVAVWANDTGAFVAGSLLGKHKLFPSVSPKKTWEGFAGGLLASVLAVILLQHFGGFLSYNSTWEDWSIRTYTPSYLIGALYGVTISVFATWGDLFESLLKRTAGVKDSGKIIPGHGGVLDRIDSLLFVFPALYVLFYLLQALQIIPTQAII